MSHNSIFKVGQYHVDSQAWRKTIPPKKMEIKKSSGYVKLYYY